MHMAQGVMDKTVLLASIRAAVQVVPEIMLHLSTSARRSIAEPVPYTPEAILAAMKHYGPGPHESGSPQEAHAGDTGISEIHEINDFESRTRNINTHEESLVVDGSGNVILKKNGDENGVKYTDGELDTIKNSNNVILTHNHPIVASLSNGDIAFAAYYDLAEIRAVDSKYTYIMRRPDGGWSSDIKEIGKIKSTWQRVANSTAKEYVGEVRFSGADQSLLTEIATHAASEAVSKRYGVPYVRIPNK